MTLQQQAPKNFRPMLSAKIESEAELKRLQNFPYYVSPKLDGIRTLLHPDFGPVTRKVKRIPNESIFQRFGILYRHTPLAIGLDGELTVGAPQDVTKPNVFNLTQSAVMSQGGSPEVTYWVFDSFGLVDPNTRKILPFSARISAVQELIPQLAQLEIPGLHLVFCPQYRAETLDDILQREASFVNQGFEGIMIRRLNGDYKFGRSTLVQQDLIKIKRWADAEGEIVGFEELMHNDNEQVKDAFGLAKRSSHKENMRPGNTLGTLRVKVINGPYAGVEVGVSGFDDALRKQIWDNRPYYLSALVNFKYQHSGSKDKPRFPIFRGFRSKDDVDTSPNAA